MTLTRVYHFSAGHRLASPSLSPAENVRLYGACARPHGHNYYLEVTLAGRPDPITGMLVDVGWVDKVVQHEVLEQVDHWTLEDADVLRGVISTGESLAQAFWRRLAPALAPARLDQVAVVETAKNRFEYRGES